MHSGVGGMYGGSSSGDAGRPARPPSRHQRPGTATYVSELNDCVFCFSFCFLSSCLCLSCVVSLVLSAYVFRPSFVFSLVFLCISHSLSRKKPPVASVAPSAAAVAEMRAELARAPRTMEEQAQMFRRQDSDPALQQQRVRHSCLYS